MLRKIPFIAPMTPTSATLPPTGPDWSHEVKFDGFRAQIHVEGESGTIYSRNGADLTRRFRALRPVLASIRARSAIIDCELVACDETGLPSFRSLMVLGNKAPALCLWCFDLLALDGVQLMQMQLVRRRALLNHLVNAADDERLQFSDEFKDPLKLLAVGEKMGLEGIVSKRRTSPYSPGPTKDWLKIKTAVWRESNRDRWEMFQKQRS